MEGHLLGCLKQGSGPDERSDRIVAAESALDLQAIPESGGGRNRCLHRKGGHARLG
jgi:hypothetical protein